MQPVDSSLLEQHQVLVDSDNRWQQRARLMQALWREERGLPAGSRGGKGPFRDMPLGSRLAMPQARELRWNYLTAVAGEAVSDALASRPVTGALIKEPRIWDDLLSSQPLCFNLFGELAADLDLATKVLQHLWPDRIRRVTAIRFEYSPGRGDARFLGTKTAFDICVEHSTPAGGQSFIAIEMKYHENMTGKRAPHRRRFDEVAEHAGVFATDRTPLTRAPLQQMWLDHLLALALWQARPDLDRPLWLFVYPELNDRCAAAATAYASTLADTASFEACSLERLIDAVRQATTSAWPSELHDRYLSPHRLAAVGIEAQTDHTNSYPTTPQGSAGTAGKPALERGHPDSEALDGPPPTRTELGGPCL